MSSPARHSREKSGSSLNHHHHRHHHHKSDFSSTIKKCSPSVPPVLLRKIGRANDSPLGKVKVMLKVCEAGEDHGRAGLLGIDQRKKQVTLVDPRGTSSVSTGLLPEERRVDVSAPKMFAFDGIFGADDDQAEICSAAGPDLIASVIGGEDGSFVALGSHVAGKRQTMFGRPQNQRMGVVPTGIAWLFKCLQEQREKQTSRYSVRISAAEIAGSPSNEAIEDLLLPFSIDKEENASNGSGTGSSRSSAAASILGTLTELTVASIEHAGFYLDKILDGMSKDDPGRHFIFTLHVYRYDKNGHGAAVETRSRLHFVMLGSSSPSLSGLGGLLLAVLNGQRHLPSRGSKLGSVLRECIGSLTCRVVIMIHVSDAHSKYAETLAALQLGSRIHRLRRSRRLKMGSASSGNGSGGSSGGSGEEMRMTSTNCIPSRGSLSGVGEVAENGSSDIDPSSSEQSCDTVIYLGPTLDDATDGEHPPVYLPPLDAPLGSLNKRNSIGKGSSNGATVASSIAARTCSPKPRSSKNSGSDFSSGSKSEEQWVDGPKVPKHRHISNGGTTSRNSNKSGGGTNGSKKSETWIDGPAARVQHQASNFPSPKKISNSKLQREYSDVSLSPSICSNKAEMIQKWISNHATPTFLNESPAVAGGGDCVECPGLLPLYVPVPREMIPLHTGAPSYHFDSRQPYDNHLRSSSQPHNNPQPEREYKQMTVFKTSDDNEDNDDTYEDHTLLARQLDNEFEFEIIEVEEPEVPVPTADVCIQVTEEDIAQSYQELEENPLPESEQGYGMTPLAAMYSCPRLHPTRPNGSAFDGSLLTRDLSYDAFLSSRKNEDHPLRALSEEHLSIVSTFPESVGKDGGKRNDELPRFCPRFGFDVPEFHNEQTCNGLCKHLVTLSHMSLNHPCINGDPFKESP